MNKKDSIDVKVIMVILGSFFLTAIFLIIIISSGHRNCHNQNCNHVNNVEYNNPHQNRYREIEINMDYFYENMNNDTFQFNDNYPYPYPSSAIPPSIMYQNFN